jgi:transposase
MGNHKFAAADVHAATTTFAVLDDHGKFVMETIVETKADSLLSVVKGISGTVHLTFEEGTHASWLYDLLKPHVAKLVVCDPRKNRPRLESKSDRIDARQLARWLRSGDLSPVHHDHYGTKVLKELVRGYEHLVGDSTRAKNRLKAIFRSRGVSTPGEDVYGFEEREGWLSELASPGLVSRAEWLYSQLESLDDLRKEAKKAVEREARRHRACALLKTVPGIGQIRAATIVAHVASPYRFRTKRQFWTYCGFAVVTWTSNDWAIVEGHIVRNRRPVATRGLNRNHNRSLKNAFKSAAKSASGNRGVFKPHFDHLVASGMREQMARLTVARKIAATSLAIWKKGEKFDLGKAVIRTE